MLDNVVMSRLYRPGSASWTCTSERTQSHVDVGDGDMSFLRVGVGWQRVAANWWL